MVTGRAQSQSRPVRRLSTRVPASIASITRARKSLEYGPPHRLPPQNRISADKLTRGQALGNPFNARLRCP